MLSLPVVPSQNHHEQLARLPPFPAGDATTRLSRGRQYLADARAFARAQHDAGAAGLSVCRLISEACDRLVRGLWQELAAELAAPPRLALAALGGYGRREMAPCSDLDLVLLCGEGAEEAVVQPCASAFSTLMWDLKLALGFAVRTPEECALAAERDHTVRTALLDCRYVGGDEGVYQRLFDDVLQELLTHRAGAFIADKRGELASRRERYGDSVFLLEPHVKQGEGGLRDLEAALWIAFARFRTRGLSGLLAQSILPAAEVDTLKRARDFLLRIRHQLHYARGRKEDRLTFDLQEEVARAFGYTQDEPDGPLPVERFMQHYYLSASAIRRAADSLIARCEEVKKRRGPYLPERRLGPFKVFRGRLTFDVDQEALREDPALLVRIFRVSEETRVPLYSWARDQISKSVALLEARRDEPSLTSELLALLNHPQATGMALEDMHELGVLGALLPEFGRITALHQHDLYHVYTVDVHSLFALRRLYSLRAGALIDEEPRLSHAMRELEDPIPLYLGMLLHDAGKGLGGDHSARGVQLARAVSDRLRLSPRQGQVLEFLVREHLTMSRIAQRRDLSDPALIAEFAAKVGDTERLRALHLLTYADIASVGPNMWTRWKADLIGELAEKAEARLNGRSLPEVRESIIARWRALVGEGRATRIAAVLPERYFSAAELQRAALDALMLERSRRGGLSVALRFRLLGRGSGSGGLEEGGFTELSFASADKPGLLALLTGVLAAHRIDILRARIHTTSDGRVLDIFDVHGPIAPRLERTRWRAVRSDVLQVLAGRVTIDEVLARRRTTSLLAKPRPPVGTKITIDNHASAQFTVVDVRAEDRPGLLFTIAQTLASLSLEIALAKVTTEVNRAIDSFYVSRAGRKLEDEAEIRALQASLTSAIAALART